MRVSALLACILACVPSILFLYNYLDIPTKLFSIIIFATILSLILFVFVFNYDSSMELKYNALSPNLLLCIIYVFAILLVQLIPGLENGIFVELASISFAGWLRAFAGLMISVFIPGYAILSLLTHKFDRISISVLSVLLSIFINTVTGLIAIELSQSILPCVMIVNIAIIFAVINKTVYGKIKHPTPKWVNIVSFKIGYIDILLLLLCLFQLSIVFSVFFLSNFAVPNGDMWDHASIAAHAQTGGLSRFGVITYPPFFSIHLLVVSQVSGLPLINSANLLSLLSIFTILAFYVFTLKLGHNKQVASLSTFIWAIFGSFTFLILGRLSGNTQALLNSFYVIATGKTQALNSIYNSTVFYVYAPVVLTTISVLALAAVLIHKEKSRGLYIIEALLFANLFLMHIAEIVYVFIFFIAALLLGFSKIKDLTFMTLGVLLGGVLSFGVFSPTYAQYMVFLSVVLLGTSLLFMKFGGSLKLRSRVMALMQKVKVSLFKKSVRLLSAVFILFGYAVLVLIWKIVYIDNNNFVSGYTYALGALPTYFLPVMFGVPMLISVIFLATQLVSSKRLCNTNELKVILFLILALLFAFFFGKVITFANTLGYAIYMERRIISVFGQIVFSIISAYGLYKLFSYFKKHDYVKKQVLAIGLGALILLGSGSIFLSASYWSNEGMGTYPLSTHEIDAMEFLKGRVNSSTVVLTYNLESMTKVRLTGAICLGKYWLPFRSASSTIPKSVLPYIDYIYLTKQDLINIQRSQDSYMKFLVSSLPVVYNNSETVILEVPQILKYSNSNVSVPVIMTSNSTGNLPQLLLLDYLGISYRICESWDDEALLNSKVAILLGDVKYDFEAPKYLNWIRDGGHLIVLGLNSGYFSELIQLRGAMKNLFEETWYSDDALENWTFNFQGSLNKSDLSITEAYTYLGRNSLMLNSTSTDGILDMTYPREWPREFPFVIGTWFNLVENKSSVGELLILGNGISSGITLWDNNYKLDYYYGGKLVYDIADISPGCWQKLELLFPDPNTCEVYLNDTLIFTGPRSVAYDNPASRYAEQIFPFHVRAVGKYLALWNGLYYSVPDSVSADGILYQENMSINAAFNVSRKESLDKAVDVNSWYTFNNTPVAPFTYSKSIDKGTLTYIDFAIPIQGFPKLSTFRTTFLQCLDKSLLDYVSGDVNKKSYPITIMGDHHLEGCVDIVSNTALFQGDSFIYSLESINGSSISAKAQQLAFNSPYVFTLSLNGTATLQPLHDEYAEILIPNGTQVIVTFSLNYGNETYAFLPTIERIEWRNITRAVIYSNSTTTVIVKIPTIRVNGTVQFENSVIDYPYSELIKQGGGALTLQGEVSYVISASDETGRLALSEYLSLNGSVDYGYPTIWALELPIASISSIISAQNVVFLIIIFIFILWIVLALNSEFKSKGAFKTNKIKRG